MACLDARPCEHSGIMATPPLTAIDIFSTRRIVEDTKSVMEKHSLAEKYSAILPTEDDLADATKRLDDAYNEYVRHVSPAVMTISLPTSAFILALCERLDVSRAVDFGSGFTSYVLRSAVPEVFSVDDSLEWLTWTRGFLDRHHQPTAGVWTWDEFKAYTHEPFDLVVYDFSNGQTRLDNCHYALTQLRKGGVCVFDDCQQEPVQKAIANAAREAECDVFGLREWTLDTFHRYAALAVIP